MNSDSKPKLAYYLGNTMYINLTNLCTNDCVFCIRSINNTVAGANLMLESENVKAASVIEEIKANSPETADEIVFCGYGEPLIRLEMLLEVAKFLKQNYPNKPVRINTNGQACLIHKRNIVPELVGLIDKVSVSLNGENADVYQEISQSKFEKNECYQAVKDFIKDCVAAGIETTATIVVGFKDYKVDIEKCRQIAEELGANFRIREWLDEGYN